MSCTRASERSSERVQMQVSVKILHADVVDVEVVASRDRANAVKNIFRTLRARQRLHGYIGVGKNAVNCGGHGFHQLFGALKSNRAREAYGEIGEVAVAGPADAHPSNLQHALDAREGRDDLGANSPPSGPEPRVGCAARHAPA